MSRLLRSSSSPMPGFPRVSGDEPLWGDLVKAYNLFSPRERG